MIRSAAEGVITQHVNDLPHEALKTVGKVARISWELLSHTPHSQDLSVK